MTENDPWTNQPDVGPYPEEGEHGWMDVTTFGDVWRRQRQWLCACGKTATTDDPHGNGNTPEESDD